MEPIVNKISKVSRKTTNLTKVIHMKWNSYRAIEGPMITASPVVSSSETNHVVNQRKRTQQNVESLVAKRRSSCMNSSFDYLRSATGNLGACLRGYVVSLIPNQNGFSRVHHAKAIRIGIMPRDLFFHTAPHLHR